MHFDRSFQSMILAVLLLVIGYAPICSAEPDSLAPFKSPVAFEPFESGDRVAFLGDSITATGRYVGLIRLFYATRFPDRPMRIYNCGIGGATAPSSWSRIDADCLHLDPTAVIINLGMNDARANATPKTIKRYQDYMTRIMDRVSEKPERELALIVPSAYDQTSTIKVRNQMGKNDSIRVLGQWLVEQGDARQVPVVDFNTPLLRVNAERQKDDPAFSAIGTDRVHPGVRGHTVMAHALIRAQGIKGPVARVEIHAADETKTIQNAVVSKLKIADEQVSFIYAPKALPYPIKALPFASTDEQWVPFTEDLNREWLVVNGLKQGHWTMEMDGKPVGTFSSNALAEGIDLARQEKSPSYQHAHEVLAVVKQIDEAERNLRAIARVRWLILEPRGIDIDDPERSDKAVRDFLAKHADHAFWQLQGEMYFRVRSPEKRDAQWKRMQVLTEDMYEMNQPKPCRVELRLVKD